MTILAVRKIDKWYGTNPGILGVDLSLGRSTVCGILGANGAGKTTLLHMITAQIPPTSGEIILFGEPVWANPTAAKRRIGYVSDDDDVPDYLTGREYLEFVATVHGLGREHATKRSQELLEQFEMETACDRVIKGYSHGMKKKIQISASLMNEPGLIVVDEPTNGLDPISVMKLRTVLRDYTTKGHSVIVATHDLAFAAQLCDYILIVVDHKIRAVGSIAQLLSDFDCNTLEEVYLEVVRRSKVGRSD